MSENKTHYRKAFKSPYLSSADIVEPTVLTIKSVKLSSDQTKKTKDSFNTAHFEETHIRDGEDLKPMILNATNSRTMRELTGSAFIDDWNNVKVTVYVDNSVRFGRDTVEGLRISKIAPIVEKPTLTEDHKRFPNAVAAFKRDGNLDAVREKMQVSDDVEKLVQQKAAEDVA